MKMGGLSKNCYVWRLLLAKTVTSRVSAPLKLAQHPFLWSFARTHR